MFDEKSGSKLLLRLPLSEAWWGVIDMKCGWLEVEQVDGYRSRQLCDEERGESEFIRTRGAGHTRKKVSAYKVFDTSSNERKNKSKPFWELIGNCSIEWCI